MAAITVENLSKHYQLGLTHAGSVRNLVNGWASRLRGTIRRGSSSGSADTQSENSDRVDENNRFWALRDINFTIPAGEVVGIIGKNGAGKSTLLKILSRITSPSSGRVTLRGRVASLLEVGTGFHPELTGRENVYMNGTILGMTRREIDREFDAIVAFAGIDQFIDTPVKRYSSGMTVRLGFAVAAHLNPEILIVDEVLAVGDSEFQKKCIGKMQQVSESGRTVLFVSHNMASIRSLTTRSIVLTKGKTFFDGDTDEAIDHYLNENTGSASDGLVADGERAFSGLTEDVRFVRMSAEYRVNETFRSGTLHITLALHARRNVTPLQFGITLLSHDLYALGSAFSGECGAMQAGESRICELKIPALPLAVGDYRCSISVSESRTSGQQIHDSLSHVLPFSVPDSPMTIRHWHRSWGQIQFSDIVLKESESHSE